MDTEANDERSTSPLEVLQHLSEEAVRVAEEALQIVCHSPIAPQTVSAHKRSQSDVGTLGHRRNSSFQRLKIQMQRAWRWSITSREEGCRPSFNPEVLANQKRQWYQLRSKTLDHTNYKEPTSLFEHFIIVGLHPDTNLEAVEVAFAKRKRWEMEMAKSESVDVKMLTHRGPSLPILEPQVLFKYPPGNKLAVRSKDLAAFCFPGGVKAWLPERTPSLSDLNELVYGQEHLGKDDSYFIFSLKVEDNATLYGVCLRVSEIVQRAPGILSSPSPLIQSSSGLSRFLVSAPRCYCVLTRVPFFELHFEMLNSIIAQERLNRITQITSEMSLTTSDDYLSLTKFHDETNESADSPCKEYYNDLMNSAIPVQKAVALSAAAAGIITDDAPSSSQKTPESGSPESETVSETSDLGHTKEIDQDCRKSSHQSDDNSSEASDSRFDALERSESCENGCASPDVGTFFGSRSRMLENVASCESLFSLASEEENDEYLSSRGKDFSGELILGWAKEHKNDLLQIVCSYHAVPLPPRGSKTVFQPLEHLQAIEYNRLPLSAFEFSNEYFASLEASEVKVNSVLAAAEEAHALSIWTTATICRVLSLETVMVLVTGVLLEKQVVVHCPNLGILSATVLSLIPMIRPFQWQSLLLPVLPGKMLDFLEAPVPFIVGIQNKPADIKIKTSNLIQVNVLKDQLKTCNLPALPRRKELIAQLRPIHDKLSDQSSTAKRQPVYRCSEVQVEAATQFLAVMRQYSESLCSDLKSHTITSVQSNNDRVSVLLKDTFIDSFPSRDRAFIKLLIETQLFTVLSDSRLSSLENRHG